MKWRGLEYEECTWEMEGDLEDYMHLVQAFLDREKFGESHEPTAVFLIQYYYAGP